MFSKAVSAVLMGIDSHVIRVEADISNGLPFFELVGYLSAELKEARERVRTAIRNAGFLLQPKRVIVNLSPADIRKSGTVYDLSIAAAVLCGYGYIPQETLEDAVIVGELSLNGQVRGVNGVLSIVLMARRMGYGRCIVPADNAYEGAAVDGIAVYGVRTLKEMVDFLNGSCVIEEAWMDKSVLDMTNDAENHVDFSDIAGQPMLKRSMEIAAAGMHNILLIGPPGAGKSMAARRLPTIMPALTYEECLEISEVYSAAGLLQPGEGLIHRRPFRCPHHTVSDIALTGGGKVPKPGEISLAHRGVLFLDELTEFSRQTMEIMRQPLEDRQITINRVQASCRFPADFMLVAAINPCRCGYYPDVNKCRCTPLQIQRYLGRISRPLLDRIDLNVEVKPVQMAFLQEGQASEESSEMIRQRVEAARRIQSARYEGTEYLYNSQITDRDIEKYCPLGTDEYDFMKEIYEKFELSARAYHKILKVARTIADLSGADVITVKELGEAAFYKSIDRKYWGGIYGKK